MKRTKDISLAAKTLRAGELVAFATETVYGLGADGCNDTAVAKIFTAKQRPQFNPLIIHVASQSEAEKLGKFNDDARKLAAKFWPGPLTLIVPRANDCPVSLLVSAGLDSLAIRVPAHTVAQQLLNEFDGALAAPSANPSGSISPTTADHVIENLADKISMVLDGGQCEIGLESTIISCLDDRPQILRHGGVVQDQIKQILALTKSNKTTNERQPIAPGQLASHYAPKATLRLNAQAPQKNEVFLGFGQRKHKADLNLSDTGNLEEAAANLFKMLHELDKQGIECIAVAPIPDKAIGKAINERLSCAAAPRPQKIAS